MIQNTNISEQFMNADQILNALEFFNCAITLMDEEDILYSHYIEHQKFLLRVQRAIAYDRMRFNLGEDK